MRDRLNAAERALWRRVALTVRPLPHARLPEAPVPSVVAPDAGVGGTATAPPLRDRPTSSPRPPAAPRQTPVEPSAATLDGVWDRRLRTGRLVPDMTIDLHGNSAEAAHALVEARLRAAASTGARLVLIVTGKGSRGPLDRRGVIRANLPDWLGLSRLRPLIAGTRPAHVRHGGGGAIYVVLRRAR